MAMVTKKRYSVNEEVLTPEQKTELGLPSYVYSKRVIPVKFMPTPSNEGDDGNVYLVQITSTMYYDEDGRLLEDFTPSPVTKNYDIPVTSALNEILDLTEHDVTVDEDVL